MATTLYVHESKNNGIGVYRDMDSAAGSSATTGVVNTVASGTEIQWTKTGGGELLTFISGRSPAGGWTLSGQMTFSFWAQESSMSANCGIRVRVFKRTAAGSETEIGSGWAYGSPTEISSSAATEYVWNGTPSSTSFSEDDRILVRVYAINVGTMGGGYTCTLTYDAASGSTGDSYFQINETISFKAESAPVTVYPPAGALTLNGQAPTVQTTTNVAVPAASAVLTAYAPSVRIGVNVAVPLSQVTLAGAAPTVSKTENVWVGVPAGQATLTGLAPTVSRTEHVWISVGLGTLAVTGYVPTVQLGADVTVAVPVGLVSLTGLAPTVSKTENLWVSVPAGTLLLAGLAPTVSATANVWVKVPAASVVLTGHAPIVTGPAGPSLPPCRMLTGLGI